MLRVVVVVAGLLVAPSWGLAQSADPNGSALRPGLTATGSPIDPELAPRPEAAAVRTQAVPALDGEVLADPVWQPVTPLTAFWQTTPDAGAPSSERTEVRVLYTADTLYIGVVCFDSSPSGLVVTEARRDSPLDDTDAFSVILDTYHDRQSGFVFATNPTGLEYDGQVVNEGQGGSLVMGGQQIGAGGGFNLNWDGSWAVRTTVSEIGWSAEFAIPFRTLRYPAAPEQTWGLNFQRNIRRRNETAYWAPLPRQFTLFRLSQAGTLKGLEIGNQRNLKITPYALGRVDSEGVEPDRVWLGDVGGDLKYSVTPSLTLDGTVNTDFAQVEVDDVQINLDRFNLFYPEKRPFFLENAGLFAVGSAAEVELFFSRRIGLDEDGVTIPIIAGGRLSGQVAPSWNVGVLNMQTTSEDLTPSNNFTVARLRRDLPNRSAVGALFVNRAGVGDKARNGDHNQTYAVDGRWGIGRYAYVSGYAGKTSTPGLDGADTAFEVSAQRDSPAWLLTTTFTNVEANFNPEVGFLAREGGFRKWQGLVFRRFRPADFLRLHEIRPHVSYNSYWTQTGAHQSALTHIDTHWEWKNGYELHTGYNLTHEGVTGSFEIYPGVWVPVGSYDNQEAQIVFNTNEGAKLSLRLRSIIGGFFNGSRVNLTPTVKIRVSDTFGAEVGGAYNDVDLPTGRFRSAVTRTRLSYSFTPRIFVQGLWQYSNASHLASTNIRFGWIQQANTGLFVVYNDRRPIDLEPGPDSPVPGKSLVVKFSRMFDVLD